MERWRKEEVKHLCKIRSKSREDSKEIEAGIEHQVTNTQHKIGSPECFPKLFIIQKLYGLPEFADLEFNYWSVFEVI